MLRACIFILIVLAILPAQTATPLTLDEAIDISLRQNAQLNAARQEQEAARGQIEKANLLLPSNPVLEKYGSRKGKAPQDGTGRYSNYGIAVFQEFEVAGQRGLRIDVAQKNYARFGLDILHRQRTLVYDVQSAFANALASKQKVALAREVSRLQEELLGFTRDRFRAGQVSGLEVNLAEVEFSRAAKDAISAEREYTESITVLQRLMGSPLSASTAEVEGELAPQMDSIPQKESLAARLLARPDIQAASIEAERTRDVEKLLSRQVVPNVVLGGFHNRDEQRNETGVSVAVAIPLFDRKQGERREARAKAERAVIEKAGVERDAARQLDRDYNNLLYSQKELSVFRNEIVDKSLKNLDLLYLAFKEGKISFYDVRVAQRETIEMQFAYLDALLKAQQSIYALERTTGGTLK